MNPSVQENYHFEISRSKKLIHVRYFTLAQGNKMKKYGVWTKTSANFWYKPLWINFLMNISKGCSRRSGAISPRRINVLQNVVCTTNLKKYRLQEKTFKQKLFYIKFYPRKMSYNFFVSALKMFKMGFKMILQFPINEHRP